MWPVSHLGFHSMVQVYYKVLEKETHKHSNEKAVKFLITMPQISPNAVSIFTGNWESQSRVKREELNQIFWSDIVVAEKLMGYVTLFCPLLESKTCNIPFSGHNIIYLFLQPKYIYQLWILVSIVGTIQSTDLINWESGGYYQWLRE